MKFAWMRLIAVGAMVVLTSCTGDREIETTETTIKEVIKIGGSLEAYEMIEVLKEAYEAETESTSTEFKFLNSSQSSGGIQGVKDGVLDIGLTSRELTESETNGQIKYRAIASTAMLLGTNESVANVTNITSDKLKAIYRGETNNWQTLGGSNAEIILLDIPEDESEKKLLRKHYLGNLKITSRAILFADDDDVIEALQTTPNSIGPVPRQETLDEASINILTIDGIAATPENIRNGQYKLVYSIGIVFAAEPTEATQGFINYIVSEAGKQELADAGYVVIEQP